jgi:DNA-binding GntR family transcriptional regulator
MSYHFSSPKNIFENLRSMSHHLMPYQFSSLKNNSKNQENHIMPHHLSRLENNSKSSSSMAHHLMPRHISLLKNNLRNLRKSPHTTSHFCIKK